jgi:predicted GNAT family acetyltransferase
MGLVDTPGEGGRGRLSLSFDAGEVFADYRREGDILAVPHVEADLALRGTGAAGRFMEMLADWARVRALRIDPLCPYAAIWFARHPGASDVLAG